MQSRCFSCMGEMTPRQKICPHCGYRKGGEPEEPFYIVPGTVIRDRYMVGEAMSFTGFAISYVGWDDQEGVKVEIKEYFPEAYSDRADDGITVISKNEDASSEFNNGMVTFMEESVQLSELAAEPGIIRLLDFFSDNNTSYEIFEFPDGETLASFLEREGNLPEDYSINLLTPVIKSVQALHDMGLIHRDISPDNIFLTKDGDVKLINFGTYGYGISKVSQDEDLETNGYSAPERYQDDEKQGPFTDIYSLGATLYKMVTGRTPADGLERVAVFGKSGRDILMPPARIKTDISDAVNDGVLSAMAMETVDRIPDAMAFLKSINPESEDFSTSEETEPDDTSEIVEEPKKTRTGPAGATAAIPAAAARSTEPKAFEPAKQTEFKPIKVTGSRSRGGIPRWIKFIVPAFLILGVFAFGLYTIPKKFEKEPTKEPQETIFDVNDDETKKEESPKEEKKEEPKVVEVPQVVGMKKAEAEEALKELGLKYTIEEVDKADVAPGYVSQQTPESGTEMLQGDSVKLVIRSENIEIPFIVGKTLDDAKAELIKAGFSEENIYVNESDETGGVYRSVLSVDPKEGTRATANSEVTLVVAAGTRIAEVTDVIASSAMVPDEYGNTYYSYNLLDGLTYTCWTDGRSDDGIGEYIDFTFTPMKVTSIRVWNGYQKDSPAYGTDIYYMNSRVKDVELQFSDGSVYSCTFGDLGFSSEIITLPNPVEAYSMRLIIKSVYGGTADWHDTCISEIEILG